MGLFTFKARIRVENGLTSKNSGNADLQIVRGGEGGS
jgi:hypothetical protein